MLFIITNPPPSIKKNKSMEMKFFPKDRFNELDFKKLIQGEYKTIGKNYSFRKGGNGYKYGKGWLISIYDSGEKTEVWELPTALSRFIDWTAEYYELEGRNSVTSQIKKILNLE